MLSSYNNRQRWAITCRGVSMHYALRVEFLRKSKIIKGKKIAKNVKGWSVNLEILCA